MRATSIDRSDVMQMLSDSSILVRRSGEASRTMQPVLDSSRDTTAWILAVEAESVWRLSSCIRQSCGLAIFVVYNAVLEAGDI